MVYALVPYINVVKGFGRNLPQSYSTIPCVSNSYPVYKTEQESASAFPFISNSYPCVQS